MSPGSPSRFLDSLPEEEARRALTRCCGSRAWVEGMLAERPFGSDETLFRRAEEIWQSLTQEDWLEAFSHHPRIGERNLARAAPAETQAWSAAEQAGAARAPEEVQRALEEGNRAYEDRFGHVFLICATGKSAEEMLAALEERLSNEASTEIFNAAREQAKITAIRLHKLLGSGDEGKE